MSCTLSALAARLEAAGFPLAGDPLVQLHRYLVLLEIWNRRINLVGPAAWRDIVDTLALDSFHLARFLEALPWPADCQTWDFGSGAGIPGLPLRILWPRGSYHLVEAREKRALFLRTVLAQIPLSGVALHHCRAESFMKEAVPAQLLISRAFLPWEKVLGLVSGRLAPDGYALIMARAAPPKLPEDLAAFWRLRGAHRYEKAEAPAWFWLFQAV